MKEQKEIALIIDDEEINLLLFEQMLKQLGYKVITALDGDDGCKKFIKKSPKLVLIDLNLSINPTYKNGAQVIQEILLHNSNVIIIVVSAVSNIKEIQDALNKNKITHKCGLLKKGFMFPDLKTTIEELK